MEILVTHLTRMKDRCICVAGIDLASGKHVRPVLDVAKLGSSLLATNGGPLDIGNVVELGRTWPKPTAPELEDHVFGLPSLKLVGKATAGELWAAMTRTAESDLQKIFGPDLKPKGAGSLVVEKGHGIASLGCWRPNRVPTVDTDTRFGNPRIRVRFSGAPGGLDLGLTDLRFWNTSTTPEGVFALRALHADTELKRGREFVLCVGLTRPFAPDGNPPEVHWLQVNNIHFKDELFPLAGPIPKWAEL